ncbi:MAG: helix-turn-helix domain-containing protein [Lachnospiraceae bacterium]|nr:helix-turn-helix domain-containing protein [Lachnospiraceae bacterium]
MENRNRTVFHLSPGILAEDLGRVLKGISFIPGDNRQTLEDVRFYSEQQRPEERYVYLLDEQQMNTVKKFPSEGAYVVLGKLPDDVKTGRASVITVPCQVYTATGGGPEQSGEQLLSDIRTVFNLCLGVFHRHREWASKLQEIVLHRGSIDELCTVSYEYFGNPMFVHDPQLYILSCPIWKEGMVNWERDELTGTLAAPAELLSEFQLDSEYQNTLRTSEAQFFSADLRGHRDLYVNLWNEYGGYMGRLVIVELEKPIREGQKQAAEYLAGLIRDVLLGYGNLQEVHGRAFDRLIENLLTGEQISDEAVADRIRKLGWQVQDSYTCLVLYSETNAEGHFSNISFCNYLESVIQGSHALLLDERVVVLINTRVNPDFHPAMIEVLRDNLYMAGISNGFSDLLQIRFYYRQAQIALNSCLARKEIKWYTAFSAVASEYILSHAARELPPEYICDPVLPFLDRYDSANGTELLKTLRTYVLSERNTVQASRALYIGRSTLFYRLRTITELTGLDGERMAEPERNLYLRISFFLWDHLRQ